MCVNSFLSCKVVFLGESNVGKTNIIQAYTEKNINEPLKTETSKYKQKKIVNFKNSNKSICFDIWDIPGNENFRSLAFRFYENADVLILVYDITNKKSFNELKDYWVNDIRENENLDKSKY